MRLSPSFSFSLSFESVGASSHASISSFVTGFTTSLSTTASASASWTATGTGGSKDLRAGGERSISGTATHLADASTYLASAPDRWHLTLLREDTYDDEDIVIVIIAMVK